MCDQNSSSSRDWKQRHTHLERQMLQVLKSPEVHDDEEENGQHEEIGRSSRRNDTLVVTKCDDLEKSGIFIAGYRGPIHRWEHPGYQFLAQPTAGRKAKIEKAYKVIVVGDATVGKTSFVQRYVNDVYRGEYKGTVGVDFALKVLWRSETEMIKLQLWDIAGQERFTWMTRAYYRDAQGCIVMFDLANGTTFKNATKWKQDVDSKCQQADGSALPAVLLGNKCDLPTRDVGQDEIEIAYRKDNYLGWTEISAKQGLMVEDSMKFLIDAMINVDSSRWTIIDDLSTEVNKVQIRNDRKKKRKCC